MLNQLEKKSEYICNNCNKKFNYNKNYIKHKCQSSITNLSNTLHELFNKIDVNIIIIL